MIYFPGMEDLEDKFFFIGNFIYDHQKRVLQKESWVMYHIWVSRFKVQYINYPQKYFNGYSNNEFNGYFSGSC